MLCLYVAWRGVDLMLCHSRSNNRIRFEKNIREKCLNEKLAGSFSRAIKNGATKQNIQQ
jgi:hypothetical protein